MARQPLPTGQFYRRATDDVLIEIANSRHDHPHYTDDPVRRVGLVCEETGEAMQRALDLTREGADIATRRIDMQRQLYTELSQVAATALTAMAAMRMEGV